MGTDAFVKNIGEAAADDVRRHLVKEGVQAGQILVGWLKVDITDVGGQIVDGSYFRPLYILGVEVSASVDAGVDDADTLKRETWVKGLFDTSVDTGVDDADNRMIRDIGYVLADPDDADDWFDHDGKIIIVGKKPDGTNVYAGWRFEIDVPQGTILYKATLAIWHNYTYGAGAGSLYDDFIDSNGTALEDHSPVFGPATGWDFRRGTLEIQSNQVEGRGDREWLVDLGFDDGSVEFTVGEALTGNVSGTAGIVLNYSVSSGTWGGGTAAGTVTLGSSSANFVNNEALNGSVGGGAMATANGSGSGYWVPLVLYHICSFASGVSDGALRCRSKAVKVSSSLCGSGILFRCQDADHYICFSVRDGFAEIKALIDGPAWGTPLNTAGGFPANTWYNLEVELDGESIVCKINGEVVFNETSNRYLSEEAHGLWGMGFGKLSVADSYALWMEPFDFATIGMPDLEAACDDVDDSNDFDAGGLPNTRVLTTAKDALGDISGWDKDYYVEIDVTDAVQEIVNRGNWVPENHISVIVYPQAGCANGERIRILPHENAHHARLGLMWEV